MPMKRTSVLLDPDLMQQAATVLGTVRATDTIRAALERTVREAHLRNLVEWELPDSAAEELDARRRAR